MYATRALLARTAWRRRNSSAVHTVPWGVQRLVVEGCRQLHACAPEENYVQWRTRWWLATVGTSAIRVDVLVGIRNPNRTDGVRWNCNAFICPASVDGFKMNIRDTKAAVGPMDDFSPPVLDDEFTKEAPRIHEVAILDIARRAKPKGIARDFEVLRAPRHVIAMEDFTHEGLHFPDEESEWEDINDFDSLWAGQHRDSR
ncbi:hypothetical protein C8J57DRAFT_1506340 [Mycena rebaudengoi]|nr:hypothetical protein C8J57DRAFT_1506340 [Mycena rebaudengoi]